MVGGVFGFALDQFTRPVPESYTHTTEYRAHVQPDATLTNVTLSLPSPVEAGTGAGPVGEAIVDGPPGVVDAPPASVATRPRPRVPRGRRTHKRAAERRGPRP